MDKRKAFVFLIVLLALVFSTCVQAASISFVDAAYVKNGTLTVYSPDGDLVETLVNSTQVLEVNNQSAYMLDYQAGGLYQLNQEVFFSHQNGNFTLPQFNGLRFYVSWFSQISNIINMLWIIILLLVVLLS